MNKMSFTTSLHVLASILTLMSPLCSTQGLDFDKGLGFMMMNQMGLFGGSSGMRGGAMGGIGMRGGAMDWAGMSAGSMGGTGMRGGAIDWTGMRDSTMGGTGMRGGTMDWAGTREESMGGTRMDVERTMFRGGSMGPASADRMSARQSPMSGMRIYGVDAAAAGSNVEVVPSRTSHPVISPTIQRTQDVQVPQIPQVITRRSDVQTAQGIRAQALQRAQTDYQTRAHAAQVAQARAEADQQAEYQAMIQAARTHPGIQNQAQIQSQIQAHTPGGISPRELQAHVSANKYNVQRQVQAQQAARAQARARAQAEVLQAQQLQRGFLARAMRPQNMLASQTMTQRSPTWRRSGYNKTPMFWAMLFE